MRTGKLTQTAWRRSVRRQLRTKREEVISVPSPYENCSGIRTENGVELMWADACAAGNGAKTGFYAMIHAAGDLAAKGAGAAGVSVRVMLPEGAEEDLLRDIAGEAERACARMNIQITAFQGEVTVAAAQPIIYACAAGVRENIPCRDAEQQTAESGSGAELLMCGYAGLEGTLRILSESRADLSTRFTDTFLDEAERLEDELVTPGQVLRVFAADGNAAVRQIGSGGILAALWELCEQEQAGFEIDMHHIALKQETVEICEFYRLNPYQMTSAGSFLILTERADEVLAALEDAGAHAVRLGTAGKQNARVIRNGEETRYLDRPAPDELLRWQTERRETC